jgi:ribosome-associated translation inhibitor RaiA
MAVNSDSDKLKEFLHGKIAKRKKQIHPEHSARFNHDMQLQINCFEWALKKVEVNKTPIDRLDSLIRKMIKDLEKRKDKAMRRPDTDDLWTKIETLQWVLYVIFAIKNERMVGT